MPLLGSGGIPCVQACRARDSYPSALSISCYNGGPQRAAYLYARFGALLLRRRAQYRVLWALAPYCGRASLSAVAAFYAWAHDTASLFLLAMASILDKSRFVQNLLVLFFCCSEGVLLELSCWPGSQHGTLRQFCKYCSL